MVDLTEITELGMNDDFGGRSSSNFGGGLELLMNDKMRDSRRPTSNVDLEDLSNLENELNDLVEELPSSGYAPKSDLFDTKPSVSFGNDPPIRLSGFDDHIQLGRATSDTEHDNKTWDGYGKFNNIPLNPDKPVHTEPRLTKDETVREKYKYLRKFEAYEEMGIKLSKKYTMDSSLQEMMAEDETIIEERKKKSSIKFQGNMMRAIVNGLEFLNNKFDPFDIKLDGLSEQVDENISDYDEIFAELHEKYKSKASMAPELKLLFQLGGSAMMVHMTNTMFKSSIPGVDDIMRQNPDLMRSFQAAAVDSMAKTNPGLGGFMSNMLNPAHELPRNMGGLPPPIATQGPNAIPPPVGRPGNNNYARPDLNMSKSHYEEGISLQDNYDRSSVQERSSRRTAMRPDMKGPSDIDGILSGLKTRTINIQQSPSNPNDSSTVSISDLKDLQSDANMPKRSGRRKKSASNTISLDI